jgi:hypothetical protein
MVDLFESRFRGNIACGSFVRRLVRYDTKEGGGGGQTYTGSVVRIEFYLG